jgi:hypothetical protein
MRNVVAKSVTVPLVAALPKIASIVPRDPVQRTQVDVMVFRDR